jgi:hypothetical protein
MPWQDWLAMLCVFLVGWAAVAVRDRLDRRKEG